MHPFINQENYHYKPEDCSDYTVENKNDSKYVAKIVGVPMNSSDLTYDQIVFLKEWWDAHCYDPITKVIGSGITCWTDRMHGYDAIFFEYENDDIIVFKLHYKGDGKTCYDYLVINKRGYSRLRYTIN